MEAVTFFPREISLLLLKSFIIISLIEYGLKLSQFKSSLAAQKSSNLLGIYF